MSFDPPKPEIPPLTPTDREHLRLLSIFYYVLAGLTALFSLFPVIHLVVGIAALAGGFGGNEPMAALFGGVFIVFALLFIGGGLAIAGCLFVVGRSLVRCEHYAPCFVVATVACVAFPIGTALGAFTIIVLLRDSVKQSFGVASGESNPTTGEPPA